MDITYKRDATASHMVISGRPKEIGFEEEMLKQNHIGVLLGFFTTEYEGFTQFWYDITGKKSFRDFVEMEGLSRENLKLVFECICMAYRGLAEYLIADDNVYISPDTVFMEQNRVAWQVFLIYCPMEHMGFCEQIRSMTKFCLDEATERQLEVVEICRRMFEVTQNEGFTLTEILQILRDENEASEEGESSALPSPENEHRIHDEKAALDFSDLKVVPDDLSGDFPEEYLADLSDMEENVKERKINTSFLTEAVTRWIKKLKERFRREKEDLFPPDDILSDLEFDPVEEPVEETTILSEADLGCIGKLLYEGVDKEERDHIISHTPFRIGSKAGKNDAVLHSKVVSRCHAKILKENGIYYLVDLNSRNGTYINGRMIPYREATPLKPMDMITFADVTYRVV